MEVPRQATPKEFGIGECVTELDMFYFPNNKFTKKYSCDVRREIKPFVSAS